MTNVDLNQFTGNPVALLRTIAKDATQQAQSAHELETRLLERAAEQHALHLAAVDRAANYGLAATALEQANPVRFNIGAADLEPSAVIPSIGRTPAAGTPAVAQTGPPMWHGRPCVVRRGVAVVPEPVAGDPPGAWWRMHVGLTISVVAVYREHVDPAQYGELICVLDDDGGIGWSKLLAGGWYDLYDRSLPDRVADTIRDRP